MTIAVVALLLVDLAAIVVLLAALIRRRRAVTGRRGAFRGMLRVAEGELEGFSAHWKAGYGHWVRDVLVWDTAPFLGRSRLIPVDGTDASGIHGANGSVTRLGEASDRRTPPLRSPHAARAGDVGGGSRPGARAVRAHLRRRITRARALRGGQPGRLLPV